VHRRAARGGSSGATAPAARQEARAAAPEAAKPEAAAPGPVEAAPVHLTVEGSTAGEKIDGLRQQAANWAPARQLGTLRETLVFSTGSVEADLMLVGEAPGHHEERQAEPFVGPAGQKLNDILKAMGIERASIYISNIVKFRPAMANQTTNNRKPTAEEMAACLPFIREEVKIVRPKCLVALGGTAAEGLLGLSGAVGQMRGKWHDFDGIPTRVTYHPAYLLHGSAGLADRRRIWEDMLAVMEQLGMPISDKQRGFFLPKK
jgi:DNA polymerase